MHEDTLPETWADARKVILTNSPWVLLLVTVERAFEGHYYQAAVALLLCGIALGIAIHRKAFEGLGKPEGRSGIRPDSRRCSLLRDWHLSFGCKGTSI